MTYSGYPTVEITEIFTTVCNCLVACLKSAGFGNATDFRNIRCFCIRLISTHTKAYLMTIRLLE